MRLDYIEIGTSDFETLVETSNGVGISIEPLSFYLDKLPTKENNIKLNVALSDVEGVEQIYYINPDDIKKYNLPDWLRGCNSIKKPHPSAIKILTEKNLTHLYKSDKISVITWDKLIRNYNITSVDYLKLDTEGHDTVILNSVLNSSCNILPKKILFESNMLTPQEKIKNTLSQLMLRGYEIVQDYGDNILVELKSNLPTKIIFASDDSRYLNFWRDNSKLCSEILKITPVLIHITNENSDFYWDEFGLVKKIKHESNMSLTAQTSRLFSGVFFPNEKLMISDIDMFLFNKHFIEKCLINSQHYDVTIIGADAYEKSREECSDFLIHSEERFPMCYIVCYGSVLNQIMKITTETKFSNFIEKNAFRYGFNSDEIVFSNNLLNTNLKINRVNRGYLSNFYLKDRIEKYMFSSNLTFRLDIKKLKSLQGFVDIHCANYEESQDTLKHLLSLLYL